MAGRSSDRNVARGFASITRRRKGTKVAAEKPVPESPAGRPRTRATGEEEERAILVGTGSEPPPRDGGFPMLDELAELARTAGARVSGRLYQRQDRPHAGSYLGTGKLKELAELARESEANLVITDDDLSPAQVRKMEDAVGMRVVDRSELIIDIFAIHARTEQARLQVELAQLQYQAPRLKRMWTHLSRITGAGGIGSRGPGEKQIEVDRRLVQERIQALRKDLEVIEAREQRLAASRKGVFRVALVGYTNVGKSTLMRALTGADVFIADQLFATLDTRTRRFDAGAGQDILLSDTVGFIRKLPHHLVASFRATLAEVRESSLLLHVVDAGDPEASARADVVREVLEEIGAGGIPEVLVLNKCDLLPNPVDATIVAQHLGAKVCCSAATGEGLDRLRELIRERAGEGFHTVELRIPAADGRALAMVSRVGRVLSRHFEDDVCVVTASLPEDALGPLARYLPPRRRRPTRGFPDA